MEKLNVKSKLLNARAFISNTSIKKEGKNKFSNYDYFTPSQITSLVTLACLDQSLITVFRIEEENDKYNGILEIHDIDGDMMVFSIPTAMPDIKATNITQKLGGMVTYTQRYLEMIAFGITDNNLDLDSQDNTGAKELPPIDDAIYDKYVGWIAESAKDKKGVLITVDYLKERHTLNKAQESALLLLNLEQ